MYLFFSPHKKDLVWDKDKNKPLAQFMNGQYQTENKRDIKILKELGYQGAEMKEEDKKE
jgi:hypothetical protein